MMLYVRLASITLNMSICPIGLYGRCVQLNGLGFDVGLLYGWQIAVGRIAVYYIETL